MNDSILDTTKKALGIDPSYTQFDPDIIMHINSVFTVLNQLGAGPEGGYLITDRTNEWSEFIGNTNKLELIKSYMFLKVRLLFDPPATGSVMESYNKLISEFEWRINAEVDY